MARPGRLLAWTGPGSGISARMSGSPALRGGARLVAADAARRDPVLGPPGRTGGEARDVAAAGGDVLAHAGVGEEAPVPQRPAGLRVGAAVMVGVIGY